MLNGKEFDLWADGYDKAVGISDEESTPNAPLRHSPSSTTSVQAAMPALPTQRWHKPSWM